MSLLEMVVVIGIYTILSITITGAIAEFYKLNSYTVSQADEVENARRGMIQWGRDAKELTVAENGSYPVAIIDEHIFGYYSDTDLDNSVEYVEYRLATTTLRKYIFNPIGTPATYDFTNPDKIETLSLYVQNILQSTTTFAYYDNAGMQLSSTSPVVDVRFITAQLIINIDPERSPGEFMLRSSIAPRNLKDNL